ncbi:MAG: C10 family peptidase [Spirochaetaceae bacterium]|nr:C10 family peptidase [Spirochaetaceae bacterium]
MKKHFLFIFLVGMFTVIALCTGCPFGNRIVDYYGDDTFKNGYSDYEYVYGNILTEDHYIEHAQKARKQQLINIAKTGAWETSDISIKNALQTIYAKEMHKHIGGSNTVTTTLIDEYKKPIVVLDNPNRSSKIEPCKEFTLSLYELKTDRFSGYAITSPDKRIGNIIAIIESPYKKDDDIDFAIDFQWRLERYLQHVADMWNSITDEDINTVKTASSGESHLLGSPLITKSAYTFSDWQWLDGNSNSILKTKWDQGEPFNTCITAVEGELDIPAGSTTVQVAQILLFHKYASFTTSPHSATIREKWIDAKDWDGTYDWNMLTQTTCPTSASSQAVKLQVGAFIYDIAKGCRAKFAVGKTTVYDMSRDYYFRKCGYTVNNSFYSLDNIKKSINAGCPVPITGTARSTYNTPVIPKYERLAFIVDGYVTLSCRAEKDGKAPITIVSELVHCNIGCGGKKDGWYFSDIFTMGNRPPTRNNNEQDDPDTKPTNNYLRFFLTQLNMLKPKQTKR